MVDFKNFFYWFCGLSPYTVHKPAVQSLQTGSGHKPHSIVTIKQIQEILRLHFHNTCKAALLLSNGTNLVSVRFS